MVLPIIIPAFGRASLRKFRKVVPMRLVPVKDLLASSDPEDRMVLNDWIESQEVDVVTDLWELSDPTDFQRKTTLALISRGTRADAHKDNSRIHKIPWWPHAFKEASRQLAIHRHALWVRLIKSMTSAAPIYDECLLDFNGHSVLPAGSGAPQTMHVTFRARCSVPGCLMTSIGSQPDPLLKIPFDEIPHWAR